MKQPNLGYVDVKLNFACMHPAGCPCRVSLCDFYDRCGFYQSFLTPSLVIFIGFSAVTTKHSRLFSVYREPKCMATVSINARRWQMTANFPLPNHQWQTYLFIYIRFTTSPSSSSWSRPSLNFPTSTFWWMSETRARKIHPLSKPQVSEKLNWFFFLQISMHSLSDKMLEDFFSRNFFLSVLEL